MKATTVQYLFRGDQSHRDDPEYRRLCALVVDGESSVASGGRVRFVQFNARRRDKTVDPAVWWKSPFGFDHLPGLLAEYALGGPGFALSDCLEECGAPEWLRLAVRDVPDWWRHAPVSKRRTHVSWRDAVDDADANALAGRLRELTPDRLAEVLSSVSVTADALLWVPPAGS